VQLICIKHTGL